MTTITIHKVTCIQGIYADEVGTGYALRPWGRDTDRIRGYSQPVAATLAEGYQVAESHAFELLIYPGGLTAEEAIAQGILVVEEGR